MPEALRDRDGRLERLIVDGRLGVLDEVEHRQ